MKVELEEIAGFLAQHEPFARLPEDTLRCLPAKMAITYVRRGARVIEAGQDNDNLYVIRSGAVDVMDSEGNLLDRRDAGRNFGYSTLVDAPTSRYTMEAVEDSVLLILPREAFAELVRANPGSERYFASQSRRIRAVADELREGNPAADVLRTPMGQLVAGRPVALISASSSIAEAARAMEANRSSYILVEAEGETGILTDRDLRSRVVARMLDPQRPVAEVMTSPVRTIGAETMVFEAMLIMSELGFHHLPVEGPEGIVGVAGSADIMRPLQNDPIYLAAAVDRADEAELKGAYQRAAVVAARFLERGASAAEAQRLLSSIADNIARRLVALAIERFGPAPVPFAFVAVGSQARREMGPASDQDNALILDDSYDPAAHPEQATYFADVAEFVCAGLSEAGQALCPGDMMATNPHWRMREAEWNRAFHGWVTAPEPDALLHTQVFFDFRCIAGDAALAERVHTRAVAAARGSRRLHTHLAALATRREPPLGLFRGFVVERSGDYADTLDVKKGGTAAVVQMARLYAITAGVEAVDTLSRLKEAAGTGVSARGAEDLIGAYEYLSTLALRHQARQLRAGERPDYRIDPKQLPGRDRDALRDAFGVIKSLQSALTSAYPVRAV
ncbi:putative nucleotidyltransferase substrate binding domain-containing protein [Corynebacterium auris]|uniref:putative nucleotidyltransferase substrate binding domain-containing protein n=1 Tax=Corynebacterium auris TaxID=44750 RepID=UPI0025B45C74|nr:putative nucleotidyltransferase substrate binding domain-containing protein [Corynebacterium auris]WJY67888.1 Putative nucleotidyltransferase substrate binding domain protein [Corynebacterium auris]